MAQPILKRRLNPLLLISTVAALSFLAGVSVIAQDQISQANQNASETQEKLAEARTEVKHLTKEKRKLSDQIKSLNNTISSLNSELEEKKGKIENKTEKISELEEKVDEFGGITRSEGSETVKKMNHSIDVICNFGDPANGEEPSLALDECNKWGYYPESQ